MTKSDVSRYFASRAELSSALGEVEKRHNGIFHGVVGPINRSACTTPKFGATASNQHPRTSPKDELGYPLVRHWAFLRRGKLSVGNAIEPNQRLLGIVCPIRQLDFNGSNQLVGIQLGNDGSALTRLYDDFDFLCRHAVTTVV